MFLLDPNSADLRFPPVQLASPEGLLAIGGDLRAERLLEAYRHGIFPWYSADQPILWWSPDPRMVLRPAQLRVSRSLAKTLRAKKFAVTLDSQFRTVMHACAAPRSTGMYKCRERHDCRDAGGRATLGAVAEDAESGRDNNTGTWITPEMIEAYERLHTLGYAHSVECWRGSELVGGLYGVALGAMFFGESMFARASDASKVAFVHLVRQLQAWSFTLIDCQVTTAHLASLGAREIRRSEFMRELAAALEVSDRRGPWTFDATLTLP